MKYTIKPLEWEKCMSMGRWFSKNYVIFRYRNREDLARPYALQRGAIVIECHASLESAKAAAEADWQERIKEALEPVQDWISVEERLPEDYDEVLVSGILGNDKKVRGIAGYRASDGDWLYQGVDEILKIRKVTHWQPMPVPPKEAQQP